VASFLDKEIDMNMAAVARFISSELRELEIEKKAEAAMATRASAATTVAPALPTRRCRKGTNMFVPLIREALYLTATHHGVTPLSSYVSKEVWTAVTSPFAFDLHRRGVTAADVPFTPSGYVPADAPMGQHELLFTPDDGEHAGESGVAGGATERAVLEMLFHLARVQRLSPAEVQAQIADVFSDFCKGAVFVFPGHDAERAHEVGGGDKLAQHAAAPVKRRRRRVRRQQQQPAEVA
jgi:hypothetical protein